MGEKIQIKEFLQGLMTFGLCPRGCGMRREGGWMKERLTE